MLLRYIMLFWVCISAILSTGAFAFEDSSQQIIYTEIPPDNAKQESTKQISLIMAGDALLHTAVYEDGLQPGVNLKDSERYDFSKMLNYLAPLISKHDLAFYNQESILGGTKLGLSSYPAFNSPQEFGDAMLQIGFNLVSLANNHTLDRGEKGVRASLQYWRKQEQDKNILTAGSYESFEDRTMPRILEKNGITYTLLAYTYGTNGIPIPKGKEYLVNVYTKEMLKEDITRIRDKVVLIISMHWGVEYVFTPTQEQQDLARLLADLGVDIVIGNHPHVIQPIELINDCLVVYSLGNMLSAQRGLERKVGMLVKLNIIKNDAQDSQENKESVKKIALRDVQAELIYTYHDNQKKNFKVIPFSKLDEATLPNAKDINKQYLKTIGLDSQSNITIDID